ncbi:MAG: flagellin [Acidobacteriota bacterium]
MSFRVNTNVASLQSREYLRQTSESQSKTISRVTSGVRLVTSGDDAAGLSIANSYRSDQTVLAQGVRNANDGLSTLQTLDGGLNNIGKLLDRARTLATQSASGTFSGDRGVLNSEFASVIGEIDRQAQSVGLSAGGSFAKSLSVFIGGGRSANGISSTANGSVSVDLSTSSVDAKSLGLRGVQAQGVGSIDIGSGSVSTSVQAILNDATNKSSQAVSGFTDFYFRGAGFGDSNQIRVSVNTNGVTDLDSAVSALNAALDTAGTASTQAATAFRNAGIRAAAVTDSTGKRSLSFTSASSSFQVAAGDRTSNALLGNVTSTSNPTGLTLSNTVTGGASVAAAGTTQASSNGTITVRVQGASLASPVDLALSVTGGTTTVSQVLSSLTSAVAGNSALQAAGISLGTATAGSALVFNNSRGERFEVQASGDLNNILGLGSYRGSTGAGGSFDYTSLTGSGNVSAGTNNLEISVGGGAAVALSVTSTAVGQTTADALNSAFASNSTLAAAGLNATASGNVITIASSTGTSFRLNSVGASDFLGLNAATATGVADTGNAQAGNTTVNSFVSAGSQQTSTLTFNAIRNADDDQTITISANDAAGNAQSLSVNLANDATTRNARTVDEAIGAINTQLQQSNNSTLRQIVAVKAKDNASGAEGIRFTSTLSSFRIGVSTNKSNTGISGGVQGTVVTASTVGTGSTASIDSEGGASRAVSALSEAVTRLGTAQANIGRGQNQFTFAVNLAQSQLTNLAASESRIRDADLAEEAANLTKAQILLQAGISALSQANSAPQQVLSLLRG